MSEQILLSQLAPDALKRMLNRWDEVRRQDTETLDASRLDELWLATPRPYPGLRSFSPDEEDLFFARDDQILGLMNQLEHSRIIVVLGGSGSGKSSLVRAGLIPRLSGGTEVPGRDGRWYIVDFRPGEDPNRSLLRGLCDSLFAPALGLTHQRIAEPPEASASPGPPALGKRAVAQSLGLPESLSSEEMLAAANRVLTSRFFPNAGSDLRTAKLDEQALFGFAHHTMDVFDHVLCGGLRVGKPNLLLLVDQFEEAFRPEVEPQALHNLRDLLKELFSTQPAGLFLAVTMRSEEEHRATEIGLANIMTRTAYHLGPLDEERDRDEIIIRPARAVLDDWIPGWLNTIPQKNQGLAPYRPELIAKLTAESRRVLEGPGNRSDHLPLLQHALLRIWDVAAERWKREAEQKGGAVDLLIGINDFKVACGKGPRTLDGCLNHHADEALKTAQAAAGRYFGDESSGGRAHAERLLLVTLCTLARRDDRNNWARRFTSPSRIAALVGDGCPNNEAAATVALETLRKAGYLNIVRRGAVIAHDGSDKSQEADTQPYDVSHEALIRRWHRLRDEVLPAIERLAEALAEVERNLNEWESGRTIRRVPWKTRFRRLRIWSAPHDPAASLAWVWSRIANAVRTIRSHASDWWRDVSEASPAVPGGRSTVILRRLKTAPVRIWDWINETPEKLATATVPDRVRGALGNILAKDAKFPRPLGAALLADMFERERAPTGGDARHGAVLEKRQELELEYLRRIQEMESPWLTASRYSRHVMTRPIKLLVSALVALVVVSLVYVYTKQIAALAEEQRKSADFEASAAEIMALSAHIGTVSGQGLAIEIAAFELQSAIDKLDELEKVLITRAKDITKTDPTLEKVISLPKKTRLEIGIPQFEHSSEALNQWIRSLLGRVTLRHINETPLPAGKPACIALKENATGSTGMVRTAGGQQFGLSYDHSAARWTAFTSKGQDARPQRAEMVMASNSALPTSGLLCLSADASVAMSWEASGLPQFWALPWTCEEAANGSCQRWSLRMYYLPQPLLSPDLPAPAEFNEKFGKARDAVLEGGLGPEGIFLLKPTGDMSRAGFDIAFGDPANRLIADFGEGFAVAPIVDAPVLGKIIHVCSPKVPGQDCPEVNVGSWGVRWAERPFDMGKADSDGCLDTSCKVFLTIYNKQGFRLGEVQLTSGSVSAFAEDGQAILIGDEHGIWRRVVVDRLELRKHLDALEPSSDAGPLESQKLTSLCQTYRCESWIKPQPSTSP